MSVRALSSLALGNLRAFCCGTGALVALAVLSCRGGPGWTTLQRPIPTGGEQVAFTGTVHYLGFGGEFYELLADNGAHYSPTNLPPEFRREALRIEATMQLRQDFETLRGTGPLVTILRIRPSK